MRVVVAQLPDVSAEWDPLFENGPGFQASRLWFEAVIEAALPKDGHARFILVSDAGRPVAMLPVLVGPGSQAHGLTTVYTCLFQPGLASGLQPDEVRHAGAALGAYCRRWAVLLLDALDPEWPGLQPLLGGFRDAGLQPRRFEHFGNWYEPVAGCSWLQYLAARPGQLRETIRRKTRACARDSRVQMEVVRSPAALPTALAAYEDVYRRSWKVPEPAPGFTPALLRRAAAAGVLRLGVLRVGNEPIAAQYWTVADGTATVLKLAHDDAWRSLSPGTVLTAHMIAGLLDEGVATLDFGRGDDAYKAMWSSQRRLRIGVLLANPRRLAGLSALARHTAGLLLRRLQKQQIITKV